MSTNIGHRGCLCAGAFAAALVLTTNVVAAEPDTPAFRSAPAAPRFRGAVGFAAGAYVAPESSSLLTVGLQGQLGIQYNDRIGLVIMPSLDVGLLRMFGLYAGMGLLADFTLDDSLSVGFGPDLQGFLTTFETDEFPLGFRLGAGLLRGGRARLTWTPLLTRTTNGTRKAMALALDLRALGGAPTGQFDKSGHGVGATYAIWSTLSISYQVF